MAKSSKVEDYWREHNIDSLFKELTQILVRRTPIDPAIAIVEHLHKKYPKSFKTTGQSDVKNESFTDVRRSSNQSQVSGIVTIPSMNSAFTDLFNRSAKEETEESNLLPLQPERIFKNLVFANRFGQQVVKLGKNIRTDRDILAEELIKPIENKLPIESHTELLHDMETHDEPTVSQIIKYKQQIRRENDRRIHREKMADVAKQQREREEFIRSDLVDKPEEMIQQQIEIDIIDHSAQNKSSHKSAVNSKEEEEVLNDENIFQPTKQRERTRQKTPRFNLRHRSIIDPICRFCGHIFNKDEQQLPTKHIHNQIQTQSIESTGTAIVDDWFETGSNAATPPQPASGSITFRRNLFQPIVDSNENEVTTKRSITPRLSETGLFARSPSTKKLQTSNANDDTN